MTNLKMIQNGVPRDKITQLAIPMIPVKILFTIFISRYTVGPRPMNVWLYSFAPRLILGLSMAVLVYIAPLLISEDGGLPTAYYVLVIALFAIHRVFLYAMFVAIMAFFARISDPAIGGTFMTLSNTMTNLGNMWPSSFVLWFVDIITHKNCVLEEEEVSLTPLISTFNSTISNLNATLLEDNVCYGADEVKACKAGGLTCETITEGYYILSIVCFGIGLTWLVWGWRTIKRLQEVEVHEWRVVNKIQVTDEAKKLKAEEKKFKYFYCF
jgi:PAT family acetyl-CoA transporter-like MFS transporter 1